MVWCKNTEPPAKPQNTVWVSSTFTSQVGRFNSLVWLRLGLVFGTKLSVRSSSALSVCVWLWRLGVERPSSVSLEYSSSSCMAGERSRPACTRNQDQAYFWETILSIIVNIFLKWILDSRKKKNHGCVSKNTHSYKLYGSWFYNLAYNERIMQHYMY